MTEDNTKGEWRRAAQPNMVGEGQSDEYSAIPDSVRQFITYFRTKFREGQVEEIHSLYQFSFNKISDRYYKNTSWPPAESISSLVDDDAMFLLLYKELYYRHIYAKMQPTLAHRLEAWENYCELFNMFLSGSMIDYDLPASWIWDITDEFVYQFEAWCQYRSKLKSKSEEEVAFLRDNGHIWNVNSVLQYLHALVNKSNICPWLLNDDTPVGSPDPNDETFDLSSISIYRYVGYFSIINLLRIHCLLGDYRLALMVLQPLDLNSTSALFTNVSACHIALFYYMGFAQLMLRKYEDAIQVFTSTLLQFGRIKQYHTRSYQYDQINKRNDQMLFLLGICVSLTNTTIDDAVNSMLSDKLGDKLGKLSRGDESVFEEVFSFACPKFISPAPPDYDVIQDYNMDAPKLQIQMFLNDVRQQFLLPQVRSYLKLYTSIEISKLAKFMNTDEDTVLSYLLCLKYKNWNVHGSYAGPPMKGAFSTPTDIHFCIDGDVIHIADTKVEAQYGEYFTQNIKKLDDMQKNMKRKLFRF